MTNKIDEKMSKIDEVIDRLEKSCVDFDFIDEESTTIASWVTFGQILGILNKLRPYVELGELISKGTYFLILENKSGIEAGTVEHDKWMEYLNLIQQIKEKEK